MQREGQHVPSRLTPSLVYDDVEQGVQWLQTVLGFEPAHVFRGDDGTVVFAELHWQSNAVFVSGRATDDSAWAAVGPASIALAVDTFGDVDKAYERATAAGADIVRPPSLSRTPLFPDGSYQFDVRDPGGHLWTVGTYRPTR